MCRTLIRGKQSGRRTRRTRRTASVQDASRDLVLHPFRQVLDYGCPSAAFVSNRFQRPTVLSHPSVRYGLTRIKQTQRSVYVCANLSCFYTPLFASPFLLRKRSSPCTRALLPVLRIGRKRRSKAGQTYGIYDLPLMWRGQL